MTSMRVSRTGAAVAGALLLTGLAAGSAMAYPPGTSIAISVASGGASATVTNAQPGCTLSIYEGADQGGTPIGSGVADSGGMASIPLNPNASAGSKVNVIQSGTGCANETAVTTAPGTATPTPTPTHSGGGGTTPGTGAGNVALGAVAGLGALALGGGLIAASRRRQV